VRRSFRQVLDCGALRRFCTPERSQNSIGIRIGL
jgi:hypothetical protein